MNSFETGWKPSLVLYWYQISTLQCCMQKSWIVTYHPGLAAEVVDGVEGVHRVDATVLEADDEAAEVLSQCHAVGVLPDQDKVRLEGPGREEWSDVLLSNAQQQF